METQKLVILFILTDHLCGNKYHHKQDCQINRFTTINKIVEENEFVFFSPFGCFSIRGAIVKLPLKANASTIITRNIAIIEELGSTL